MGRSVRNADPVTLGIHLVPGKDKSLAPVRKSINHRNPHPVETPGNLVRFLVELTPRVEPGHNQLQSADSLGRMDIHRNTPAIILHPDHIVPFQHHQDSIAEALHSLVHRVIHHLENQMMETVDSGGPDVHTRALAHRLKTLQNLDVLGRIS